MQNKTNIDIKEITYISVGVAIMIAGGFAILHLSYIFPIPGVKYILMSPYLSFVIYLLLSKIKREFTLIKFGVVFGFIMVLINLYMGAAIIITALLSQISIIALNHPQKAFWGAIFFSTYTGVSALIISKYFIGGILSEITFPWIVVTGVLCSIFGVIGVLLAKRIQKYFHIYSFES